MDRHEHADALRQAMAERQVGRQAIADATGKTYRSVSYWISRENPTLPSEADRATLRRLLGPYDQATDPVERAILMSDLTQDRKHGLIGFYLRLRREQELEEGA